MLGYRKRPFAHAHAMLSALRENHGDVEKLRLLQQLLCREIIRTEKKIRELKAERKGVLATGGRRAKKRSSVLMNRIEKIRHCAYVWRCFGDAIAFAYLDKFGLKQCFYSTEHAGEKQSAGFLSDKSGLAIEIAFLEFALEKKIPALLVDLTDTIRYGDICLLDGVDPFLMEVKAGETLDRRGKRQKRNLAKLHDFLETDRAEWLRGHADVRREAIELPERGYVDQLNACIAEALTGGYAVRSPERGLHYVAMTTNGPDIDDILQPLQLKKPWLFQLNEFKAHRAWAPYYPFVLSIEAKDHLWAFIRGDLYLMVIVEQDVVCQVARGRGYDAQVDLNQEGHALKISGKELVNGIYISLHMLRRIGLEFVSPEWMVLAAIEMASRHVQDEVEDNGKRNSET